jgi:hypothetical protein
VYQENGDKGEVKRIGTRTRRQTYRQLIESTDFTDKYIIETCRMDLKLFTEKATAESSYSSALQDWPAVRASLGVGGSILVRLSVN